MIKVCALKGSTGTPVGVPVAPGSVRVIGEDYRMINERASKGFGPPELDPRLPGGREPLTEIPFPALRKPHDERTSDMLLTMIRACKK